MIVVTSIDITQSSVDISPCVIGLSTTIEPLLFSINSFEKSNYGEYFIYVVSSLIKQEIEIIEKGYVCETRKYGTSKTATSLVQLIKRGYPYIKVALEVRK